jgi:predicted enzyme related to lactoylglutathione lyase
MGSRRFSETREVRMANEAVRGRFLWYDLLTTDPEAAKRFYGKVVGWKTETWSGGEMPYEMWQAAHGAIGGIMQLPAEAQAAGAPPNWLAYVGVPDVDAAVAQVESMGGRVWKEAADIPTVGRFAVLADPYGAVFAVYTPAGESPPRPAWPQPGDFSWHELMTADLPGAFDFYAALFGWEKMGEMDMGEAGLYQMYGLGGVMYGGMMKHSETAWVFYALVDSADAAAERARAEGAQVLVGPMEVPGGDRVAVLLDPQGAAFGVHSRGS